MAKFRQELYFGIPIKIRMVWLLFETSRNFRNFSCPDTGKMAFFYYFRGISKKCFRKCKRGGFQAKFAQ